MNQLPRFQATFQLTGQLLTGLGLTGLLMTCKPKQTDVLPGIARFEIATANQQRLYFVEDSSNRQVSLLVTYYDAGNSVVTNPALKPQYFANGQALPGNTFATTRPGSYTFTAKVGDQTSSNTVGPITVSRAADYAKQFRLRVAVSYLNADSISRLPLTYNVLDPQGNWLNVGLFQPKLLINGTVNGPADAFQTNQPGPYTLQADFFGVRSNPITVTGRRPVPAAVVRLPVIIHLPQSLSATVVDPARILAQVNATYRKQNLSTDPNQADTYLEFYPAKLAPDGQPLPVAGLHPLDFDDPGNTNQTGALITNVLHEWCPRQYINVFVSIDWLRTYPAGYSYAYIPDPTTSPSTVTCNELKATRWDYTQLPAVFIYNTNSFAVLAHELGHFLGLQHTFYYGCSAGYQTLDTPKHLEARPDASGYKLTCDSAAFVSQYVMDYYVAQRSFTLDQTKIMQQTTRFGDYIPATGARGGRRGSGRPLQTGRTIACPPPALIH